MAKAPLQTSPKPFCFVLMPFNDEFNDIYQLGIKEACEKAGAYCERVDEQIYQETILARIYNQIAKADFIIADMTGRNANVFYEVGYAHALGTPTILLTQNEADIPFDLKHFPHIVYGNQIVQLQDDLRRRVEWFVDNPSNESQRNTIDIDLYLGEKNLASGDVIYDYPANQYPAPFITVHNASSQTLEAGNFKLGVKCSAIFSSSGSHGVVTTALPNGEFLHMLHDFPRIFPDGYASTQADLIYSKDQRPNIGDTEQIVFRVFTSLGTRDYPLTIRKVRSDG